MMKELTSEERQALTDHVGEVIIREARDGALRRSMKIAKYQTPNPADLERFEPLSRLTKEQQEAVCCRAQLQILFSLCSKQLKTIRNVWNL